MEIRDVFVLEEALADLANGRLFYEERQPGLGDYFWDPTVGPGILAYLWWNPREGNGLSSNAFKALSIRHLL